MIRTLRPIAMSLAARCSIARIGAIVCAVTLSSTWLPANTAAKEPYFEFLRAAQDRGYGEVAIEYLRQQQASGRMPPELAETLDLELSRSYRAAVAEAFNAAEAENRMAKARTHLDKFLNEHPDHGEFARAMESWGDIELDQGREQLRRATASKNPDQQQQFRAAARTHFEEARPRFVDATARYLERYQELERAAEAANPRARRSATSTRKQRDAEQAARDAEFAWLECRFKSAKIDFCMAESYANPQAPERQAALTAAATAFDDVFQSYRESRVGLHAHLWHGRAVDELGNDQLALDIYDEVLATAPDGRERETGLEPLFALAQYYRLRVLQRTAGGEAFLAEAEPWLEFRRAWRSFDGYQGVLLEVARTHLEQAKQLSGSRKAALVQSSLATLADMTRVRSEHQQEAILLRRQYTHEGAASTDPASVKTFDEAVALGEAAIENLDWSGAAALFARALELKPPNVDADGLRQVANRLDQARYQLALTLYSEGKLSESLRGAEQIVHEHPDGAAAPAAGSLAVSAALSLYARAQDKKPALQRLDAIAQEMIRRWPDKAEADDARIALGQASLVRGEFAAAASAFENVNPRSLRYSAALYLAGQTNWRMVLMAKAPGAAADPAAHDAQRDKAAIQLQTCIDLQREAAKNDPASAGQLDDAQLLLAELKLESGDAAGAGELVEPLAARIVQDKPKPLANTHLRILLASARAQAALGQLDMVAAAAALICDLGEDNPTTNGVLNTTFKLLVDAWKEAEAAKIEASSVGDANRRATAAADVIARRKLVADLAPRLAARKQNSLAALIFIADRSAEVGKTDVARELYTAILARGEADQAFQQSNGAALTRIQAQLVGLLRQKGQFNEALIEVNKLVEQFPNALEPLMEKGRVLQGWADEEPERSDDAVAHWTLLRTRLMRLPRKPPEYYEVVFNAANCLFTDGLKSNDPQKALQAEQLLNATLVLSPKLSGPELVARYKALMRKSRQLQGRPVEATANP
jgi:hypothetical protein